MGQIISRPVTHIVNSQPFSGQTRAKRLLGIILTNSLMGQHAKNAKNDGRLNYIKYYE